jgi:hypothetical protein
MLRKLIVLGTKASGTSLTISAPQQQTLSTPAHASGSMPNFAAKIDVKIGSKIALETDEKFGFFGQPNFLLCSGGT